MTDTKETSKLITYIIGFILSIMLTLLAYFLVVNQVLVGPTLITLILGFAIVQLVVQLLFFLHLGNEQKPHWNLIMILNTIGIIFIVIVGSIWIMTHLNYNMHPKGMEMDQYLMQEENIQK
jgi:cytochrome o ubiquinol oxidase subunit IV